VVAGGLGTMAAAPALARARIDVQAYEQAHQLTETSADVSLAPNGLRMLKRLGVGEGGLRRRPAEAAPAAAGDRSPPADAHRRAFL
jgi:2-polyprenyl-6-methoxyphenol hydroxylase-like FAD-dependent oxidoreductase